MFARSKRKATGTNFLAPPSERNENPSTRKAQAKAKDLICRSQEYCKAILGTD